MMRPRTARQLMSVPGIGPVSGREEISLLSAPSPRVAEVTETTVAYLAAELTRDPTLNAAELVFEIRSALGVYGR